MKALLKGIVKLVVAAVTLPMLVACALMMIGDPYGYHDNFMLRFYDRIFDW